MSKSSKISEAFDLVLASDPPNKRRSAIVVFKPPESNLITTDRAFRKIADRVKLFEQAKQENRQVFNNVLQGYMSGKPTQALEARRGVRHRIVGNGILPLATLDVNKDTLKVLAAQDRVVAVMPNQRVKLLTPDEPDNLLSKFEKDNESTWGIQELAVKELWEQAETKGRGVKVAVLDTGVYGDHPALQGKVSDFTIIDSTGQRLELLNQKTFDYHRHGTHICGTIAGGETSDGVAIGVAPGVNLAVAQIHFGDRSFLSHIIDGIDWSIGVGADIINMSIGIQYYDEKIDNLFQLLVERGIAPIVAIGNESHGSTSCPGNAGSVLGIGALERKKTGGVDVAPYSGGSSIDTPGALLERIVKPDVVAPGSNVYSCVPPTSEANDEEYRLMDGTSMAAPHVAGVMAILMASCPEKPVIEIFKAIRETARHPRGKKRRPDNRWGYGAIEPLAALNVLQGMEG
ncbi:S8 family serine peptidase [Synechococcus sp. PCC 7336]|uniref:S8 family serine peptidase n=1 Tax=Synechococcus sp. PCC 7336 TaxID=195250 RepID=UPI00034824E1|nr:S8 family serine peptidase [Synechococcus sp. PCC 7336]